jgi:hypothetical protein
VSAGWSHPDFNACLSAGRGLRLRPQPSAEVVLELGAPQHGRFDITIGWLASAQAELTLRIGTRAATLVHQADGCEATRLGSVALERTNRVTLTTSSDLVLDYLELTAPVSK